MFFAALPLSAADNFAAARAKLDEPFAEKLESLAKKCDEVGLKNQAAITRSWLIPRFPNRQYLFLPEAKDSLAPKMGAADLEQKWFAKFQEHRAAQSESLFEFAKSESKESRAARAYQLLHEVLRENPDHAEARRILSYEKSGKAGWILAGKSTPPTLGRRAHPKYGWGAGKYWRHETPHYSIATSTSVKQAIELGQKMEELHALWRQAFFSFWTNQPALEHRFGGGKEPLVKEPKKLDVVLFKDREEYVAALKPGEPKIELTTGIYLDKEQTVFLYAGDETRTATWYHEATHQLFQEIDHFPPEPGSKGNFWMVEGFALYMESLTRHQNSGAAGSPAGSYWTLGGWESDRLQFARYRGLSGDFLMPLEKLSALGRKDLQASEDIRKIYSQAAGLSHFLMDAQDGLYREPAISIFRALYDGRDTTDAFAKVLGASDAELDRDYLAYLQVTDKDLAQLPSPERIRNLSLGRTKVSDAGLVHLAACKNLDWLDLSGTELTDTGLTSLKDCSAITQLFLEGTKISDESLTLVGNLSSLEELDLSAVPITDAGLTRLAPLKKLKILHLTNSPISDAGLENLKSLSSLESLETSGTKVTAAGLKTLRRALPKLKE
ncbi:MAG: hypothetical protein K8R36_14650 [Planctomycetales bacterium]|nr:hypothetical protein [Planctomycetales bacterium]